MINELFNKKSNTVRIIRHEPFISKLITRNSKKPTKLVNPNTWHRVENALSLAMIFYNHNTFYKKEDLKELVVLMIVPPHY